MNVNNKESLKKSEPTKPRTTSISRTDSTRLSMRTPKSSHVSVLYFFKYLFYLIFFVFHILNLCSIEFVKYFLM